MIFYYLAINLITLILWGLDKYKAIQGNWRIPEKQLQLLIIIGGGAGALLGMTLFHHKTRKTLFWVIAITSIILHAWLLLKIF